MTHDAERDAATYLAGELGPEERDRFEQHLLTCESCWKEVEAGRRGLVAAEQARELAPPHLRDEIRSAVRASGASQPFPLRILAMAAAVVVVAGLSTAIATLTRHGHTSVIAAAVADYRSSALPGASTTHAPAPNLAKMKMSEIAAGSGRIGDMEVDAFAFRDESGRRVTVYMAERPFEMPAEGHPMRGETGPWMAKRDGVAVLCARYPHELLIVGEDETVVRGTAHALDVM